MLMKIFFKTLSTKRYHIICILKKNGNNLHVHQLETG